MTHLKFKPRWKLFCGIIVPIAALGIVGLFLPDDFWAIVGDGYVEGAKYGIFIIIELFCISTLIRTLISVSVVKSGYAEINAFRDKLDENAYFVEGYCEMINKHDKDVIDAMVSDLGATTASVLFDNGMYGIFTNKRRRIFLFVDNGMYVIRTKAGAFKLSHFKVMFHKGNFKNATVTENGKGQIELTCPDENVKFTFDTKKLDVSKEQLTQHLQDLYVK